MDVGSILQTATFGRPFHWHESVVSTNAVASALAEEGGAEGTVVAADSQTAGRGRLGRTWASPGGVNLYLSLLLRPAVAPTRIGQLAPLAGLAVRTALGRAAPEAVFQVKWPNDVWAHDRKLAGILCQGAVQAGAVHYVIIGVGINVNLAEESIPEELRGHATSLRLVAGQVCDRVSLLADLLFELEQRYDRWLQESDLSTVQDEWVRHSYLYGKDVRIESGSETLSGTALGIGPDGDLILRDSAGRLRHVCAGDAHVMV